MSEKKRTLFFDTEKMVVGDRKKTAHKEEKTKSALNVMFTVVQGSEADFGKIHKTARPSIVIGRDKDNTIRLDDPKISKHHCEINVIKIGDLEQILIKDLDSTNGTLVDGESIRQGILAPGNKITIGETVLRFDYSDEIEEEYRSKLFNFAVFDSLTGLYNRRYTLTQLEKQRKIAGRNNRVFSVILIDIDDFKQINDTFGHPAGDEYLKELALVIGRSLREQDISGRMGGEEFLIILPETGLNGAFHLANRVRRRIEETELVYRGSSIKTTISAGIVQYKPGAGVTADQLVQQADHALYRAKESGKNTIVKAGTGDSTTGE